MTDFPINIPILIVDDNPTKMTALVSVVESSGLTIVTAESGQTALHELLKRDFAVVLLDVNMPIMDGFETAKMIRERPRTEHLPIIFITAERLSEEAKLEGYKIGAVDYIISPIIPEILQAKVAVLADLFRLREIEVRHNQEIQLQAAQLKIQQAELQKTEEWYRSILEFAPIGIFVVNDDGQIMLCNPCLEKMFGYDRGELVLRNVDELVPIKIRATHSKMRAKFMSEQNGSRQMGVGMELQGVRKDGSIFPIEVSLSHLPNLQCRSVCVSVRDITVSKQVEDDIRNAKELAESATAMKSNFLANMSHEIRTPMNAILGMLYLALKNELPPTLRNNLFKAQRAAHSLLGIINDILDFSKIESGKLEIERTEFYLDAVLEQLTDAITLQAEQKGVEFLIRYDVGIPTLLIGDPLRLKQVLLNLCSNAFKFTEQGEVELAFCCLNRHANTILLQVSVRDTGLGMTPELQHRLFEKFTQADQSTTRRFGGTGLGLAISKHLVALMGGKIWIEKSAPDEGTTVCFTVPLQIVKQAEVRRQELVAKTGSLLEGIRVLVVDDNNIAREILSEMLRIFKLDVTVAENGSKALTLLLESAKSQPFDLVLMDWRMPDMNGDETILRLHYNKAITPQPKVIMITAYDREDVLQLAEQARVDAFLTQPVSPSTLLDTILTVLGRGRVFGETEKTMPLATISSHNFSGVRILLVEDNEINREFATELLRSLRIIVDEAMNGEEAVTKVQQHNYDAVLMDIQMPVMDGLDATRKIRALANTEGGQRFATLPIIAMTALAMAKDAVESQAAGMNDYVTKPVEPERLFATLAKWLPVSFGNSPIEIEPQKAVCPPELLALESLRVEEGIRRIGGNIEAYCKQLKRFRDHYAEAVTQLQQVLTEQGAVAAEHYCHALKGVAGNIGAYLLYDHVSLIDAMLKRAEKLSATDVEQFRVLLNQVIADIDSVAVSASPIVQNEPLSPEMLNEKISLLMTALKTDLGTAETLMMEVSRGVVGSELEAEINTIAAQFDAFNIDDALESLTTLRQRLNAT